MSIGNRVEAAWIDCSAHELFPLDRAGRFARYVKADSIDATNLVNDAIRNARQDFVWNSYPIGSHSVLALHDAERDTVFVGALIAHYAYRPDWQKNGELLPDFIVPVGGFHLADDD